MNKDNTYKINLDLPPEERWNEVTNDYKNEIINITKYIDDYLLPIGCMSHFVKWYILRIINGMINKEKIMYIDELKSIAKITGVALTRIILIQMCYEATTSCTSYMFRLKDTPVHFRTMDWNMLELGKMTINLEFVKNNNVLFKATSFAGYVGIMTAMKPEQYSIALNFRLGGDFIWKNIGRFKSEYYPAGYLIREVLCEDLTFINLLDRLENAKLIAPCYFSGFYKDQAFRIIRSPEKTLYRRISKNMLQCNIDHYGDKFNILYSNERINTIKRLEKNIDKLELDPEAIKNYLSIFPVNNELTIYTNVIFPTKGTMYTYVTEP